MSEAYHATRLVPDARRDILWRTLCRVWFPRHIGAGDTVLDLGSGHAGFINHVIAARRIAVDAWPGLRQWAASGVEVVIGDVASLDFLAAGSVNVAFASNLFEHLTKADFAATLAALRRVLSARGTLIIIQPNYRFAYREYFDDYTHVSVFSDVSLPDFLMANGFEILEIRPRFLPLTVKSRLPVRPWLIAAYLRSPIKPLAKQMLVRARPR